MKVRQYGIEIYGAIDAYSRYVPWTYVGVSAATAVSVATMYLEALEVVPIQPQYLRADRGTETLLIMNAHWQLHQQRNPTIGAEQTFMYGSSTANSRIESWWGQLAKGQIQKWRV